MIPASVSDQLRLAYRDQAGIFCCCRNDLEGKFQVHFADIAQRDAIAGKDIGAAGGESFQI